MYIVKRRQQVEKRRYQGEMARPELGVRKGEISRATL